MPVDITPIDCTCALAARHAASARLEALTALHAEIARLEALAASVPPRLVVLRQQARALKAYARTLAPVCAHTVVHEEPTP